MISSVGKSWGLKRLPNGQDRPYELTIWACLHVIHAGDLKMKDVHVVTQKFSSLQAFLVLLATACFSIAVDPANAQVLDVSGSILPEIEVRGRGWEQLANLPELLDFAMALLETTVMVGLMAYHPVSLATRRTRSDFEAPRDLFVYGLIGMVVGFLIMHHGYLIGFVLFGLGGLLRFKSDGGSADTVLLILVTLIGLSVGLDLPLVALITTLSAWAVIYAFGGPVNFELEVRFADDITSTNAIRALREHLSECGFKTVSMSKTKFKPMVTYVVSGPRGFRRSALEREMVELVANPESGIADWHVD